METAITNIYQLRSAQFKLQQKLWDRNIDDLLRLALHKPLDGHGDARKSAISSKLRNVFRLFFRDWFAVGPDIQFTDREAMFNARGFRRATFNEGRGYTKIGCRRTWCRAIKALKDAGIISAYQEPNQGDWWVRFNSDVVAFFHEQLMAIRKVLRSKRKSTPCDIDVALSSFLRASGSGSPSTSSAHSVDRSEDEMKKIGMAEPASAVSACEQQASTKELTGGDAPCSPGPSVREQHLEPDCFGLDEKTNRNSFGSVRLDEQKTRESIAFYEARELVLEGATGNVVRILTSVFPELDFLPAAELLKIKRLVSMPKQSIFRLDERVARELCRAVQFWPEVLKGKNTAGETLDFSKTETFMELLPFWRPLAKVLRQLLLAKHDDQMFDQQYNLAAWEHSLLGKRPPEILLYSSETDNPAEGVTRLFANALKHNRSDEEVSVLAARARWYLLENPIAYFTLQIRFPQVRQICQIPDEFHNEVIPHHTKVNCEVQLWESRKEIYGFRQNDFSPHYPADFV